MLFILHTLAVWALVFNLFRFTGHYLSSNHWENRASDLLSLTALMLSSVAMIVSWAQLWFVLGR